MTQILVLEEPFETLSQHQLQVNVWLLDPFKYVKNEVYSFIGELKVQRNEIFLEAWIKIDMREFNSQIFKRSLEFLRKYG